MFYYIRAYVPKMVKYAVKYARKIHVLKIKTIKHLNW